MVGWAIPEEENLPIALSSTVTAMVSPSILIVAECQMLGSILYLNFFDFVFSIARC